LFLRVWPLAVNALSAERCVGCDKKKTKKKKERTTSKERTSKPKLLILPATFLMLNRGLFSIQHQETIYLFFKK